MDYRFSRPVAPGKASLFQIVRPSSYRDVLNRHLVPALVSGCILLAGRILPLERMPWRVCMFFRITGYPCPTCGWTRGFIMAARGDWPAVMHNCPFALVLYLLIAAVFLWHVLGLVFRVRIHRGAHLRLNWKRGAVISIILLVMVMANWCYRLAMGFD